MRRPSRSRLFPDFFVLNNLRGFLRIVHIGNIHHGNHSGFPVECADALFADVRHSFDDRGNLGGLTLDGEGVLGVGVILADPNGVVMSVAVVQSPGPGGFRYHDLFAISIGNVLQYVGQILRRAMPEGVVGAGPGVPASVVVTVIRSCAREVFPLFNKDQLQTDP